MFKMGEVQNSISQLKGAVVGGLGIGIVLESIKSHYNVSGELRLPDLCISRKVRVSIG